MPKIEEAVVTQQELVFIVMRYQSVIGVYKNRRDAFDVCDLYINKGQICDVICKPLM